MWRSVTTVIIFNWYFDKDIEETYVDAVVMEGLTGVEFVRRVVFISGQELTPKFAVNIRKCRQIEGETRHSLDAGDGAVKERGNESRSNLADIEIVMLVFNKVGVEYSKFGVSFKSFGVVDLLCRRGLHEENTSKNHETSDYFVHPKI